MRNLFQKILLPNLKAAELLDFACASPLLEEEKVAISTAVEQRREEFRAGRDCARRALAQLGYERQALPAQIDRTVRWPQGSVGSLTHTNGYAAAVVARVEHWGGLGIDAELEDRVAPELWRHIAGKEEIDWFSEERDPLRAARRATLLFSAKEAFYKAQYCITAKWLNFEQVRFHLTGAGFAIELLINLPGVGTRGSRINGRFCEDNPRVVTLVALPREQTAPSA